MMDNQNEAYKKGFDFGYKVGVGLSLSTFVIGVIWLVNFFWNLGPWYMMPVWGLAVMYIAWALGSVFLEFYKEFMI
jgi:hypothetical protein